MISGADVIKNVVLLLAQTFEISGVVRDSNGTLASNIRVTVYEVGGGVAGSVQTDAQGNYSILVAGGNYGLSVNGFASGTNIPAPKIFDFSSLVSNLSITGNTVQDLEIPAFAQISGYTTDSNGVAVGNVTISGSGDSFVDGVSGFGNINTTSDANGWYSVYVVPSTNYYETITPPNGSGFVSASISSLEFSQSILQNIILNYADTIASVITSGPYITSITDTSAVVEWQTDEPATSEVVINGNLVSIPGFRTQHSETLSGLTASTSNTVQVSSYDAAGNGPTLSANLNFETFSMPDTTVPTIVSGPVIVGITKNRALVQWVTSEPTTTSLTYGATNPSNPASIEGLCNTHSSFAVLPKSLCFFSLNIQ